MKPATLKAFISLFLTLTFIPTSMGEEPRKLLPVRESPRAAPVANTIPPTYIVVGNQQDTSSAIRIVNNTGLKLTAHWEAVPKTATEEDYNFPFPNPETLEPGEFIDIPVTVFAELLPGFLHQVLEIFARDVAYRNWSRDDVIEDVLFQYELDRLGYWVNDTFFGSFNFQAVGLTSDEYFTFRVELRDENGNFHSSAEQDITIYDPSTARRCSPYAGPSLARRKTGSRISIQMASASASSSSTGTPSKSGCGTKAIPNKAFSSFNPTSRATAWGAR